MVSSELPDPPYPATVSANGWAPEFHLDRIFSSDTWTLAEDDERPWLLRIWLEAWRSVPVGSMPADRRLFARRIGCKTAFLEAHAEILLRGWALHADGLLYHAFIASQVLAMVEKRRRSAEKVAAWREARKSSAKQRCAEITAENVTGYMDGCNDNVPVSNRQEQETGTGQEDYRVPKHTRSESRFEEFWDAYPPDRRRDKKAAAAIWKRRQLDARADAIIADVRMRALQDRQWIDGYSPMPSTYLNGDRWEDTLAAPARRTQTPGAPSQPSPARTRRLGDGV